MKFNSRFIADGAILGNHIADLQVSEYHLDADVQAKLNNTLSRKVDATAAPTAEDDGANTSGASWSVGSAATVGSMWFDTTGHEAYR